MRRQKASSVSRLPGIGPGVPPSAAKHPDARSSSSSHIRQRHARGWTDGGLPPATTTDRLEARGYFQLLIRIQKFDCVGDTETKIVAPAEPASRRVPSPRVETSPAAAADPSAVAQITLPSPRLSSLSDLRFAVPSVSVGVVLDLDFSNRDVIWRRRTAYPALPAPASPRTPRRRSRPRRSSRDPIAADRSERRTRSPTSPRPRPGPRPGPRRRPRDPARPSASAPRPSTRR